MYAIRSYYVADEYRSQFDKALNRAGPAAADKLRAVVEHDLETRCCELGIQPGGHFADSNRFFHVDRYHDNAEWSDGLGPDDS